MLRRRLALAALALASACGAGKLSITLERPKDPTLDPLLDTRLTKFGLRIIQGREATDQDAFVGADRDLTVGEVPTGSTFDLRLAGKSSSDDMLGMGLVQGVQASATQDTQISVKFRKPMAYVAGGGRLQVLNTAGGEGEIELTPVLVPAATQAAAMANGVALLVLTTNMVVPVRTADHTQLAAVVLDAVGTCLAVSPNSQRALVCHDGGAVSLIDLGQIGTPQQGRKVTLGGGGKPNRAVFADDSRTAWVLVNGQPPGACMAGGTDLLQLDVESGATLQRIAAGRPIADVAIDPRDGSVLLAMPCEPGGGKLAVLSGKEARPVVTAPDARDLVITDRGIVVMGGVIEKGAVKAQALIFDTSRDGLTNPEKRTLVLPALSVAFVAGAETSPGYLSWVSPAQNLSVYELSVAPDGRRALALFEASYASNMTFLGTTLGNCTFTAGVHGYGYLLLDLGSGSLLDLRHTRLDVSACSANCLVSSTGARMDNPQACTAEYKAVMQEHKLLTQPELQGTTPTGTLLFGGT